MRERELNTGMGGSRIVIGESLLARLGEFVPQERTYLFVDSALTATVAELLPGWRVISTLAGESIKSLRVVEEQYERLLSLQADRQSVIVAIGGGALLDLIGFIAATYLRGVECVLIPSTLLAQVDASVGGKNGVNFGSYKNMVGTVRQPALVLCDIDLLMSLPEEEYLSGLAEIVKYGAIADREIFDLLATKREELLHRDREILINLVDRSIGVKQQIVEKDPLEKDLRRLLNFGHTVGHALEHITAMKHGYAVSLGMCVAADISVQQGLLAPGEAKKLCALLNDLGLPTKLEAPTHSILEGIAHDKKRENDSVHTILLERIGKATSKLLSLSDWETALTCFSKRQSEGQQL